jgi:hypothetical protein
MKEIRERDTIRSNNRERKTERRNNEKNMRKDGNI